ncbi:eCIS core domain-containing protein [Flavobacterium sharifuzzamanii]|uniref:eCIS core domain-containing protein n=1 Tax=Flavobacterium sharifuzzamanii TaxID=2211133 RepID=UPI00193D7E10|nr:DUF4157 domain-containing protein [Flavobacterium sharifuzzamanii]
MKNSYVKTKTQSNDINLSQKTVQNKARALQDNRPASILQRKASNTGLPDNLKSGIENLSGHSMDDVKVHYNSDKPAQLNAHAYAQGSDIHIASGQEKHLPHEAWHVVQQKQGRVKPTLQMKGKVNVNDDNDLEKEADVMGQKALQMKAKPQSGNTKISQSNSLQRKANVAQLAIIHAAGADYTGTLSLEESNKLTIVMRYVQEALKATKTGTLRAIFVNVVKMNGTNPADTRKSGTAILINMADWFLRISSVGDIAGMIAHEIGVHTLASELMTDKEKSEEDDYTDRPYSQIVGLHRHTIAPMKNARTDHRQKDHINIAKDLGGPAPLRNRKIYGKNYKKSLKTKRQKKLNRDSVNTRAMHYVNVVLKLGDAIDADNSITPTEKDRRIHDLLNSYLFDIARILVTDDTGPRVLDKSFMVAQVYNSYKTLLLQRHQNNHLWLQRKTVQPTATGSGLIPYLGLKAARALQDQNSYIGRGTIPGKVIDTVASFASPLADKLSDTTAKYTPEIVKSVARTTDRVLGEVPSFILPKVVDTFSWGVKKIKNGIEWFR